MAVVISLIIGGLIGATAGFYGGAYDTTIMRIMDILMGIPSFLFAVVISAALGAGVINTAIAIAITGIPSYARLVRASVLSIKGMEYIEAAEALGNSNMRIILKHVITPLLLLSMSIHIGRQRMILCLLFITKFLIAAGCTGCSGPGAFMQWLPAWFYRNIHQPKARSHTQTVTRS